MRKKKLKCTTKYKSGNKLGTLKTKEKAKTCIAFVKKREFQKNKK